MPAVTNYWILDPAGNGTYLKCDELDKNGEIITIGRSSGEHMTESFDCPIDLGGQKRPVIIKIEDERKQVKCIGLPMFCPEPKTDVRYMTYTFTPASLEPGTTVESTQTEQDPNFPIWIVILIVIIFVLLLSIFGCLIFFLYRKRKTL